MQAGRQLGLILGVAAGLAVAACGGTTIPPSAPQTPTPTPSASATPTAAVPTPTALGLTGLSSGAGDTSANPDSTYICADSGADDAGTLISYTTVAGTDQSGGQAVCTALEQSSAWTSISSIAAGTYDATPGCYETFDSGQVTTRIYTATPNGDPSLTTELCNDLLSGSGQPTLAP